MTPRHTADDQNSQPSRDRLPLFLGVAGAILLVLGFIIPVQGWNFLLVWLGIVLLVSVAFTIKLSFFGNWTPTMFADEERGKDGLPPPPTI